jgi:hypothetical protein
MPNGVKYSTTTPSGSLRRDNVALGVNGNLGPTANTGFYSMPTPASGKYIINKVAASGVPNFFAPQNDTELIQFARNEGATGANTGSAAAVLAWIATQPNLEAANFEYENIVTDGLVLNVDAGFVGSYPTTASAWYDISGNNYTGTLTNGPTFSSANSGSIIFDGVNDYANVTNDLSGRQQWSSYWSSSNKMTVCAFVKFNTTTRTGDRYGIIGNRYYYNTGYFNFHVHSNTVDQYSLAYNNGYDGNFVLGPSVLDLRNQWLFVSVRHNGDLTTNAVRFSINTSFTNASLRFAVPIGVYMSSTDLNLVIAKEESYHWMNISNINVYNRFLSDQEILQNYNALRGRFGL